MVAVRSLHHKRPCPLGLLLGIRARPESDERDRMIVNEIAACESDGRYGLQELMVAVVQSEVLLAERLRRYYADLSNPYIYVLDCLIFHLYRFG